MDKKERQALDEATDELTEVLANFDLEGKDFLEIKLLTKRRIQTAQLMLLKLLKDNQKEMQFLNKRLHSK